MAVTDSNGTLTSQQRYLPFGEPRTIPNSPITQTDFTYTGQRANSYIKLLDYKSRWYSDQLGRFVSPDSIVPDPGNPQSLNRYSYVLNRPINLNDPTGHDPWWDDPNFHYADSHPIMSVPLVYIIAGINIQSQYQSSSNKTRGTDPYASLGPAKVSDAQMNTAYGDPVKDSSGAVRGYGLGMPGQDQLKWGIAFEAMGKRIQLVTDACNKCNATDLFIAASQAQNGPGFDQKNMQALSAPQNRIQPPSPNGPVIDWPGWFGAKPLDPRYWFGTRNQFDLFSDNVEALKKKGWYVPDVDWKYINSLK